MMLSNCDLILKNITRLDRFGLTHASQALVINEGLIVWCGLQQELPSIYMQTAKKIENCNGRLVTPGLIDCHTHLVYSGSRADEFRERLEGATYKEIAERGGGIVSTVNKTRQASEEMLFLESYQRFNAIVQAGVTTIEIKSGYGLALEHEMKMLRVAKKLGVVLGVRVMTTFLGAHAVPPEYAGNAEAYVDYCCNEMLPAIAESGLADAVDVFCESIAFSIPQTERIFSCATALHLPIKCHAEQLSCMGASSLAAKYQALSCDHIEYLDKAGVAAMARSGTIAVLLPGAFYFLKETQIPPVELLRHANVGMAIATDCNPGSSPTVSLPLMMNMACRFFSLTVPEVWQAVTYFAAKALGIDETVGALEVGKVADLICWEFSDSAEICYQFGFPFPHRTMISGKWMNE